MKRYQRPQPCEHCGYPSNHDPHSPHCDASQQAHGLLREGLLPWDLLSPSVFAADELADRLGLERIVAHGEVCFSTDAVLDQIADLKDDDTRLSRLYPLFPTLPSQQLTPDRTYLVARALLNFMGAIGAGVKQGISLGPLLATERCRYELTLAEQCMKLGLQVWLVPTEEVGNDLSVNQCFHGRLFVPAGQGLGKYAVAVRGRGFEDYGQSTEQHVLNYDATRGAFGVTLTPPSPNVAGPYTLIFDLHGPVDRPEPLPGAGVPRYLFPRHFQVHF